MSALNFYRNKNSKDIRESMMYKCVVINNYKQSLLHCIYDLPNKKTIYFIYKKTLYC